MQRTNPIFCPTTHYLFYFICISLGIYLMVCIYVCIPVINLTFVNREVYKFNNSYQNHLKRLKFKFLQNEKPGH